MIGPIFKLATSPESFTAGARHRRPVYRFPVVMRSRLYRGSPAISNRYRRILRCQNKNSPLIGVRRPFIAGRAGRSVHVDRLDVALFSPHSQYDPLAFPLSISTRTHKYKMGLKDSEIPSSAVCDAELLVLLSHAQVWNFPPFHKDL